MSKAWGPRAHPERCEEEFGPEEPTRGSIWEWVLGLLGGGLWAWWWGGFWAWWAWW